MSYVIQNYTNLNKKITTTPRFKAIWLFLNLTKIIIFLKMKTLSSFIWEKLSSHQSIYVVFIYFLFTKQIPKFISNLNFKFVGDYDNKLIRTSSIYFFRVIWFFIKTREIPAHYLINQIDNAYVYNLYFLPIKVITFGISKFFYKNIFFYHLLMWGFIWHQQPVQLRFYLNFIFTRPTLNLFKFYSNYFLKVYNY